MYMTTVSVENASVVLNNLKSLNRPLTSDEKRLGHQAAMLYGQRIKDKIKALREAEIEELMKKGYTERDAREEVRLAEFASREARGFGTSHKCKFPNRKRMIKALNKAH